jgi:signal transduction histidine kinase
MLQHIIQETKRIYMGLRPTTLDDLGVKATLRMFFREFRKIYKGFRIEELIEIEEEDIPQDLKIVIFRITEEALHNAAKHSRAESIKISLTMRQNAIELTIEDDGVGFDSSSILSTEDQPRDFGLSSMRERAELAGGSFFIRSALGEGTAIRASWPRQA